MDNTGYIFVAYYTVNTGYEAKAKNLTASLDKLKLPYDAVGVRTLGSWQANTQYKPYFVLQMLIKHFPKDIVYLDADAVVHSIPTLFDNFKADVGVVYRGGQELLSSMFYFSNNSKVFELTQRWRQGCFRNPNIWDQKILQYLLVEAKDLNLTIQKLPHEYCQIFDDPLNKTQAVIEQTQASRELKKEIDRKPS
jgi:hypothetical protein